jgi:phage terminase small subunit
MPDYLDEEAQRIWKQLAPYLVANGLLTVVDGIQFALLCQTGSFLRGVIKILNDPQQEEKHKAYEVRFRLQSALFHRLAGEFGLSPRGRVGLQIGSGNEDGGEDLIK